MRRRIVKITIFILFYPLLNYGILKLHFQFEVNMSLNDQFTKFQVEGYRFTQVVHRIFKYREQVTH